MTTTNYSDEAESPAAEPSQLLKTDVLGRTRMCRAQVKPYSIHLKPAACQGKHSRFNMESKSKPLPMKFKSGSVILAIFDMILALDFPWQKSNISLTGKCVSCINSTCGNDRSCMFFGSNFTCIA